MRRRLLLVSIPLALTAIARSEKDTLRGRLKPGEKPVLVTAEPKSVFVEGDGPSNGVLKDDRLAGAELEVIGRFTAQDCFLIDPIHTRSMFVHKDGKRLFITYWCEVCAIRTYTPGLCMCCQQETQLDLRESIDP